MANAPQNPLVLHVARPYATVEDYLAEEAWTIDAKSMVLIDVGDVAPDTAVLFDVSIQQGDKLIRAEGKVAGAVAASGSRPAGLRVKFKRYGGATKAFIDRAVSYVKPEAEEAARLVTTEGVTTEVAAPSVEVPVAEATVSETVVATPAPAKDAHASGVHRRPADPVDAPTNRAELLARLRERSKSIDIDAFGAEPAQHQVG